jgi:hypothetical protein
VESRFSFSPRQEESVTIVYDRNREELFFQEDAEEAGYRGCLACWDIIAMCSKDVEFTLAEVRAGRCDWTIELANSVRDLALNTEALIRALSKTERRS